MAHIRRLGKNHYQIPWLEGYVVGPDGKRRQCKRSEIVWGDEADAKRRAAEIELTRVPASKLRDPNERTFGKVAAEWLKRRQQDVERGELGMPHWPLVVLAATTGLRLSELLGLRWADIDWDNRAIWVQQALKEPGSDPVFGSTKQDEE